MLWQTSPAATELETRTVDWMRQALGLPEGFSGVIQDSASSATLNAVLTMSLVYFLIILLLSWVFYTVMTNYDAER